MWQRAADWAEQASSAMTAAAARAGVPLIVQRVGTMFTPFFTESPVRTFAEAKRTDRESYGRFFRAMLEAGINLAPSQFEAGFVSIAHGREDLDRTIEAARGAFRGL
jgi:glutamate-1-semialdehyde 2,1-aminomutase